jgi:hypothetical protein
VTQRHCISGAVIVIATAFLAAAALAQDGPFYRQAMPLSPGSGGDVALPYPFADEGGNIWQINSNGWLQEQGRSPVISQGSLLYVNGNTSNQANNQARLDPKTGELVIDNLEINGVTITRRLLFRKRDGVLRYVDIFHNTQNQQQTITASITTNLNFNVANAQFIADPKIKDRNLAWAAQTAGGRTLVQIYGGPGAHVAPKLDWQEGSNSITATYVMNLPPQREQAIVHLHTIVPTVADGTRFINSLKQSAVMHGIPSSLRRIIVNYPQTQEWINDVELLRGDTDDIVELHNGDRLRGTLEESTFALKTFYGPIALPAGNVAGIVNIGQLHTRQLFVTTDGEIFGGRLDKPTLALQFVGGQTTQIPLAQISRVGFRKRPGEPAEWTFDKPLLLLRSGERLMIKPMTENLQIASRYGTLSLKPESIAAISFQNDDNDAHEITLTDGSRFTGLATADHFDVELATSGQHIKVSSGSLLRFQFAAKMPEVDDHSPTIHLQNDDLFVGELSGKLNIETAFDTLPVNTADIRLLKRGKAGGDDVQVLLWDGSLLSGRLLERELNCQLKSGMTMKLPSILLVEYSQPPREKPPGRK